MFYIVRPSYFFSLWGTTGVERLIQFDTELNEPVRVKKIIKAKSGQEIEFMSCIDALALEDGSQLGALVIQLKNMAGCRE